MSRRKVDGVERTVRGTSNRNDRGSSEDRRRRREWLVQTFRADLDLPQTEIRPGEWVWDDLSRWIGLGKGRPACRCYRCGALLSADSVTVDRIIPGCKGGTYRRNNIRPACGNCNSEIGGSLRG